MYLALVLVLLAPVSALERGRNHYLQRQFTEAASVFEAALKENPRDDASRLYLVRTLLELQRFPEALEVLQPLIAPSAAPEARLEAGRILRTLAERRFRTLQRVAGGSAATLEILGRRLEREGNFPRALEQFEAARKLEPDRPGIRYALGSVLWKMREFPRAEAELRAELARQPAHGMANLRLGQLLVQSDRDADAIPYLETARKALPDVLEISRELGKAYRNVGRLSEAQAALELVASARPGDDQVHYLLASVYRQLGDHKQAKRELEKHRSILEQRRQPR